MEHGEMLAGSVNKGVHLFTRQHMDPTIEALDCQSSAGVRMEEIQARKGRAALPMPRTDNRSRKS